MESDITHRRADNKKTFRRGLTQWHEYSPMVVRASLWDVLSPGPQLSHRRLWTSPLLLAHPQHLAHWQAEGYGTSQPRGWHGGRTHVLEWISEVGSIGPDLNSDSSSSEFCGSKGSYFSSLNPRAFLMRDFFRAPRKGNQTIWINLIKEHGIRSSYGGAAFFSQRFLLLLQSFWFGPCPFHNLQTFLAFIIPLSEILHRNHPSSLRTVLFLSCLSSTF